MPAADRSEPPNAQGTSPPIAGCTDQGIRGGDGDLPLLTAFKGAILAPKVPESGEYRLKSEQPSHWAESAAAEAA
jgi:hypothetical protein